MRILDLFSGIGGFSLGLERAGMKTVAFCEIDPKARQVLKKHWPDVPVYEDVSTLKGDQIEPVDIICGGFPCQDISLAGQGAGLEGARSGLWFEYHRLIKEIKPKYAIIENVSALRSRGLDQVLRSLAEIGYDAEWHCIPSSAIGAPHRRDRIWIVAYPHNNGRYGSQNTESDFAGDGGSSSRSDIAFQSSGSSDLGENLRGSSAKVMADSSSIRLSRSREPEQPKHPAPIVTREAVESQHGRVSHLWATEPNVGRVANGVSGRVDRLKQLGNAVVPQIPELIGRAIMEFENANS